MVNYLDLLKDLPNIDSSKFVYKNNHTKSILICNKHGEFFRNLKQIKKGILCPMCSEKITTTESFIEKANKIHHNKYDYSSTNYTNSRRKLTVLCKIHGTFELFPIQHLRGQGCDKCKVDRLKEEFLQKAKKIHQYDYSKVIYKNNKTKITVTCKKHGDFDVRPDNHINNLNGCPECSISNGELMISNYLKENNIEYEVQKKFDGCEYKYKLRFDFYLPKLNICIEYNGIQHYQTVEFFGGKETLEYNLEKDKIKEEYCNKNNIRLIVIKYDEDIIQKINSLKIIN